MSKEKEKCKNKKKEKKERKKKKEINWQLETFVVTLVLKEDVLKSWVKFGVYFGSGMLGREEL